MSEEKLPFFEKANQWIRNSVTIRLITIGILLLLMLIPVSMVQDLIREREYRQNEAIEEVSAKWGESQTCIGPVLTVPYNSYTRIKDDEGQLKLIQSREFAHFFPSKLKVDGEVFPEIRYRGIYEVTVYNSHLTLDGDFPRPDFSDWKIDDKDILWNESFVSVGLSDLRGIEEKVILNWGGRSYDFNPGVETNDVISSGISTRVFIDNNDSASVIIPFALALNFNGSSLLEFVPIGKSTQVSLASSWASPKFDGAFLPDKRDITNTGFAAQWEVLHLNRPYPQSFKGTSRGIYESAFGVSLIVPVDEYQKSTRAAKYAVMFIALTFVVFFFIQILNRIRIHPIQYIIVGLALCVFYTLLIALSEHINFQWSYLVSSVAIISMITLYAKNISRSGTITRLIGGILVILYAFIYTIIQLEDYALLMGSIGLFLVLAIVMYLSRKVDWYNIQS